MDACTCTLVSACVVYTCASVAHQPHRDGLSVSPCTKSHTVKPPRRKLVFADPFVHCSTTSSTANMTTLVSYLGGPMPCHQLQESLLGTACAPDSLSHCPSSYKAACATNLQGRRVATRPPVERGKAHNPNPSTTPVGRPVRNVPNPKQTRRHKRPVYRQPELLGLRAADAGAASRAAATPLLPPRARFSRP